VAKEVVRLTVDAVVFAIHEGNLEVLLVKRKYDPFKSAWALPGGFIEEEDESLDAAAARELREETNVSNVYLEQLYSFGDKGRDPRGRVITVAYLALVELEEFELHASSESSGVAWWPVLELPKLAFDHESIISYAHQRLKYKIEYSAAAFKLLPTKFTLRELQTVYEAVLGKEVDNRNFRKKFLNTGVIQESEESVRTSASRPAKLYTFSEEEFERLPDRPIFVFT
jgi:8-oxo-dGTP diphosphatase